MIEVFNKISVNSSKLNINNKKFSSVLSQYSLCYVSEPFSFDQNQTYYNNFNESKVIIVNQITNPNNDAEKYFIIGFEKSIIMIYQNSLEFLTQLFTDKLDLCIYFLSNSKDNFDQSIKLPYKEVIFDSKFEASIHNFNDQLLYLNNAKSLFKDDLKVKEQNTIFSQIAIGIKSCIAGYIIRKSYSKITENRITKSNTNLIPNPRDDIDENEYVELRYLGSGASFTVKLIYHIEKEKIFALKKPTSTCCQENEKLIQREIDIYKEIYYPFLPEYFGSLKSKSGFIIEFINGDMLHDIKKNNLTIKEKITVIFELMLTLEYLHQNNFIYRDLKPDNIMIDQDKNIVLIDFDRMIDGKDILSMDERTVDLSSIYIDPDVNSEKISNKCDVYSFALVMYFIMSEEHPNKNFSLNCFTQHSVMKHIYKKCTNKDQAMRPSMKDILYEFYVEYHTQIENEDLKNIYEKEYIEEIKIHANKNDPIAQYNLGLMYCKGKKVPLDIDKSIYYLSLSSNQDYVPAIRELGMIYFNNENVAKDMNKCIKYLDHASRLKDMVSAKLLGFIYYEGVNISKDINKAIYYLNLASQLNDYLSSNLLGNIYFEGKYVEQDIKKAEYFFLLAEKENCINAQYHLGLIYYEEKYMMKDIKKAINYFYKAAKQNHSEGQYYLGLIYFNDLYVPRDIKKAIYYFTKAAKQNHLESQKMLANIYRNGQYVPCDNKKVDYYDSRIKEANDPEKYYNFGVFYYMGENGPSDINQSINYLEMAAKQNHKNALYLLGLIYDMGEHVPRNINKAIHYYSRASDLNCFCSQYNLGLIYLQNKYVPRNIEKSIYYFTLAANQDQPKAQSMLGCFYGDGLYIQPDAKKSIYYFTLAAKHNYDLAYYYLGVIYYENKLVPRDITKSINYLILSANKNNPMAQYILGEIYDKGIFVQCDINKAIYYYLLSANQNYNKAQFSLGVIYLQNKQLPRDINKAIHYFTLSSDQGNSGAQNNLGMIYYLNEIVPRDINKAIYYLSLAANQNVSNAQYFLGKIYFDNLYVPMNINKAIQNFTLAADQKHHHALLALVYLYLDGRYVQLDIIKAINYCKILKNLNEPVANYILGKIYQSGINVTRDINKAINYYSQAGNSVISCQIELGKIYYGGEGVARDIKKALYYFSQAAKENYSIAQYYLGLIYSQGDKNVSQDKSKAFHYYMLAAKQYHKQSLFNVGLFYYLGIYVHKNIDKAIHFFSLASKQNHSDAQFNLGFIYYEIFKSSKDLNDMTKSIHYFEESSKNENHQADFSIGFLHHEGKYLSKDVEKAIIFYKKASTFDYQYAKNNLAIIYLYGFENKIKQIIGYSIQYFQESINQKQDILSMYNLAHIYIYNLPFEDNIMKSFELLIKSANNGFYHSKVLLCLALIKKYGMNPEKFKEEISKHLVKSNDFANRICTFILCEQLDKSTLFEKLYLKYERIVFLYDILGDYVFYDDFLNQNMIQNKMQDYHKMHNITHAFYEGFGIDY